MGGFGGTGGAGQSGHGALLRQALVVGGQDHGLALRVGPV